MGLMDRAGAKASSSLSEFGWTALNIAFDSILAVCGKILLLPFVTGPLWTRLRYDIRPAEPVFRSPIQESQLETLAKLPADERERRWNREMLRCVDRRHLDTCPADLMSMELWVVDYSVARDANALMAKRELMEHDLELSIWLLDAEGQWMVYWVPK
ncbi:hypothetical protein M0805_003548 [Coniferiporia weirii]|nr:hypothetical protein M0805_003548 [Coniferiporia weirii]